MFLLNSNICNKAMHLSSKFTYSAVLLILLKIIFYNLNALNFGPVTSSTTWIWTSWRKGSIFFVCLRKFYQKYLRFYNCKHIFNILLFFGRRGRGVVRSMCHNIFINLQRVVNSKWFLLCIFLIIWFKLWTYDTDIKNSILISLPSPTNFKI